MSPKEADRLIRRTQKACQKYLVVQPKPEPFRDDQSLKQVLGYLGSYRGSRRLMYEGHIRG